MATIDEFNKKITLSLGAVFLWTTTIISVTFTLSTIYWNFTALNDRVDKRYDRQIEFNDLYQRKFFELEEEYKNGEISVLKLELDKALSNEKILREEVEKLRDILSIREKQ